MHAKRFCYFCDVAWKHICQRKGLSEREGEILRRICSLVKLDTIARELGIERTTLDTHLERAYLRLDVHDRNELLMLLLDEHWNWWIQDGPPR